MALLSIEVGREWYSPAIMASDSVSALMRKIQIEVDPTAEAAFWSHGQCMSSVMISLKDGQHFSSTVAWPPGHWRRPFSASDVEKKFLHNVRGTRVEMHGEQIVETAMNIDRFSSLSELRGLLSTTRT
ncbi:hypothetical protein AC628_00020 [Bradyrhizobium sp. NAS96.2]|nr:hypothetical protein AC628_00020 [Bradyrhizobium sp. NAS96.2]